MKDEHSIRVYMPHMSNYDIGQVCKKIKEANVLTDRELSDLEIDMRTSGNNLRVTQRIFSVLHDMFSWDSYDKHVEQERINEIKAVEWYEKLTDEEKAHIPYLACRYMPSA
jgi:hypothetical protein